MTRMNLTVRQRECFEIIEHFIETHQLAPSRRELAKLLGVRSPGHVVQLLRGLQERGWIVVLPNKVRAIAIAEQDAPPLWHRLSPKVEAALRAYCFKHEEADPSAVVNDAVALFLDEAAGSIAA